MTGWQLWLQHPERSRLRNLLFQIHLWIGAAATAYIVIMSVTGSIIVYRNQLVNVSFVGWLVKLHDNLLFGQTGHFINGLGGGCLLLLCLTGAVILVVWD